ncbi:hypothetical protein [Sphingobium naphthae]|uniref:Uncharacterized protein n=2 Tax=Sphingobium TaxID=165695 RepID=A0A9X7UCT7_SPHYA|nr:MULTISPECIES: hypothetical protein [Sphingobium]MDV5824500.1 hypothetical protein [Sphingobium naphthae]QNG47956.1 hypothetical protein H3V42_10435 [Sphingobium yanoikuyae]
MSFIAMSGNRKIHFRDQGCPDAVAVHNARYDGVWTAGLKLVDMEFVNSAQPLFGLHIAASIGQVAIWSLSRARDKQTIVALPVGKCML